MIAAGREMLFISDLHLGASRLGVTRKFLDFLERRAPRAERLYILGDLFDAWVGDDDPTPPRRAVKAALRRLTSGGTEVYFQHGNRDFLLGERFARETGVKFLPDYALIDLYGETTVLMHGDLLCSDDKPYLEFRAKTRTAEWRSRTLGLPLIVRLAAARWYRLRSYWHKSKKSQKIMDVNPDAVRETLARHGAARLIHGHTHRPAVHDLTVAGRRAQRFVLAPWEGEGSLLCWNERGWRVERF
jgi:UDP-2,3-diacylglucosamine hydrolase